MIALLNAFSLQMISGDCVVLVKEVPNFPKDCISFIGHEDLAKILNVPYNRGNVQLLNNDTAYVVQLQGGRLPEGSTTLPEGYSFKIYKIFVMQVDYERL